HQIVTGIIDKLGPMIADHIANIFVDGLVSGRGLDRRFFLLVSHCKAATIDFNAFMDPAVEDALARRIRSPDQVTNMRQIAAERQDEWGMYLLERLAVSNRRHRGAGAVWRFMLAVQGDDRDAKRNAFYGANKIEGLHPLIMEMGDSQDVEVSANELKKW